MSEIIAGRHIRFNHFLKFRTFSYESVHHFVRGESSEFVITQFADLGIAQADIEMDGILAHPDIMSDEKGVIVELKDTVNGRRLNFYDSTFRSYLRQQWGEVLQDLYYLAAVAGLTLCSPKCLM
jgi:hypothetical protein